MHKDLHYATATNMFIVTVTVDKTVGHTTMAVNPMAIHAASIAHHDRTQGPGEATSKQAAFLGVN